jgi:Flp pilus assembly protein TadG
MKQRKQSDRRGAIVPLMVIIFPVLLILCGVAINWSQLQLVRTEMQVATDASCRAACRTYMVTNNMGDAQDVAQAVANQNLVANAPLVLRDDDFQRGIAIRPSLNSRYNFTPANAGVNGMRLTVVKDHASQSGPVNLYFPLIGGLSTAKLMTQSIAAQVELDIALVIDRSGSMAYSIDEVADPYVYPSNAPDDWDFGQPVPPESRWQDTVDAVEVFLDELALCPQEKYVSLVTYGTGAVLETDLSASHGPILTALNNYTQAFPTGATNIGSGLAAASENLTSSPYSRPYANKVIVVLTDGVNNWGPNPYSVASSISSNGVTVFTVTFSDEANQTLMQDLANLGCGKHFHATSSAAIRAHFKQIAREMPTVLIK